MELQLSLPELRKARNLTIKGMAALMHISVNGYRNKEAGTQPILVDEMIKICDILRCPLDYLFPEKAQELRAALGMLEEKAAAVSQISTEGETNG